MTQDEFVSKMLRAKALFKYGQLNPDYYRGYVRGLRRRFFGERFGTEAEHKKWMSLVNHEIEDQRQVGLGYRDGFNEM